MSIIQLDNEQNQFENKKPAAPKAPRQEAPQQTQQRQQETYRESPNYQSTYQTGAAMGWESLSSGLQFAGLTTNGTGRLLDIAEHMRNRVSEILRNLGAENVQILTLDTSNNNRIFAPMAILAIKNARAHKVGFYTFIIDTGAYKHNVNEVREGNENIKVRRLPSNGVRDLGDAMAHVAQTYNGLEPISALGCVIPHELTVTDGKELDQLIINALVAIETNMMNAISGRDDFSLNRVANHRQLIAGASVNRNPSPEQIRYNVSGMPVRTDITTRLVSPAQTTNDGEEIRSELIAESGGYVDLAYSPSDGPNGHRYTYVASFIATLLNTPRRNTLNGLLLAMYSSFVVFKDKLGIYSLCPDHSASPEQLTEQDIGMLNIEAAVDGERKPITDLVSSNTPLSDVRAYLDMIVNPVMDYVISIDEFGPDTWKLFPFLAAADGNVDELNRILEAADILTNGNFNQYYRGGNPFNVVTVRPGGYMVRGGVKEDLRKIDYVSTFALTHQDGSIIESWDRYSYDPVFSDNIRLHHLSAIVEEQAPNAQINGTVYGVSVDFDFINAFVAGIEQAGLKTSFNIPSGNVGRERYVVRAGDRNEETYRDFQSRLRSHTGGRNYNADYRRTSYYR